MSALYFVLFLVAAVLFGLATTGTRTKPNLVAAGLFCCAAAWALQALARL